ncbi:MAG: hypothetical protein RLZZ292_1038 [Bacteroidota bacterium]|jgi:hypothetical protein
MSEFQLYDFRRIDRALTREEMGAIDGLSSHIKVTTHRAVVSYSYGDFKHDAEKVLEKYFDAFLLQNSWGQKKLMFRIPNEHINYAELRKYLVDGGDFTGYTTGIEIVKKNEYTLITIEYCDEGGDDWIDEDFDSMLNLLLPLRAELMQGDYACLYAFLLKMKAMQIENGNDDDDDENEEDELYDDDEDDDDDYSVSIKLPAVPVSLSKPTNALDEFVSFFDIDADIVAAAGTFSVPTKEAVIDYPFLIKSMKEEEKNEWLNRLINNELHLDLKLKKHFGAQTSGVAKSTDAIITYAQIEERVGEVRKKRLQKEAEAAKAILAKRMAEIKKNQDQLWQRVASYIDTVGGKSYDNAATTLKDLYDMAVFYEQKADFMLKYKPILEKSTRSKALLERYRKLGLPL